jgi:flagellar assembly protein FliH
MVKSAEQQGYEKGVMSAQSGMEAKAANSLAEISTKLNGISAEADGVNKELEEQFVTMSKKILQQLIPVLTGEHAAEIVNKFIKDNFNNFRQEKKLSFYLNPDIIQYVQDNISKLAAANDFEGKISLHKDENLGLSDCRIEWENGGVESNTKSLLNKVENLLDEK